MGQDKVALYRGGDAVVDALIAHGQHIGFGVPGESYLAILDAIARRPAFRFVTCRLEAGAANMAEAYGKLTGKPGICFVTRGPGVTHATIGLHTALQDATPLILLVGQIRREDRDREAFQEIDYRRFLNPLTKWVAEIDDNSRLSEYIARAHQVATSGRPGPVALILPEDMLSNEAPRQISKAYEPMAGYPSPCQMARFKNLLEAAQRPLFLLGGSGWCEKSVKNFSDFAARYHLPVATSFRAQDRMDNDHPTYAGDFAISVNPALLKRLAESDLVVALGSRLDDITTGGYERLAPPIPKQGLVHIHPGPEEIGKVYQVDLGITASPAHFIDALQNLELIPQNTWDGPQAHLDYQAWQKPIHNPGDFQISALYDYLNKSAPKDIIYTNGAGNYAAWLHRFVRYHRYPSQLAPTSGAMGYGLPAAVAAKITHPERPVVCAAGDGCFMMALQELATAVQEKAGIIILLFNNSLFGTIRMHQAKHYPGRPSGTALQNPDFVALANSFGAFGQKVTDMEAFALAFKKALAVTQKGQPALIEILIDPDAIAPGASLKAMENKS